MPMIGARGAMSSRGLGQFSAKNLVPGTIAMVVLGLSSWRYTFASDTAVQVLSSIDSGGSTPSNGREASVGNSVKAFLEVRSNNTNGPMLLKRMLWASQKSLKSTILVPSGPFVISSASASNTTQGVITTPSSNTGTSSTNNINFPSEAVATGTTTTASNSGGSGVSTPTYGLFSLAGSSLQQTNKYAFADSSVTSGTNLTFTATNDRAPSIGNADKGIFCRGNSTNLTCKYTHAGDTVVNSTNLVGTTQIVGGWNNDVSGVIPYSTASGNTNWTKWFFANDTVAAVLGSSTGGLGGAAFAYGVANGIPGVSVV